MYSVAMAVVIFQKIPTTGCLHKGKIPMQEIGVKEGEGVYSKGAYFWGHENMVCIYVVHINPAF